MNIIYLKKIKFDFLLENILQLNIDKNPISYIIMIQPTQTMECTTEVPYISIYDKPKRRTLIRRQAGAIKTKL